MLYTMKPSPRIPLKFRWSTLILGVSLLWSAPAVGETITDLNLPARSAEEVLSYTARLGAALGAPAPTLRLHRSFQVPGGQVYRFRQSHLGLPIYDAELSTLVLNGRLLAASGRLTATGAPTLDQAAALLSPRKAAAAVHRQLPGAQIFRATQGLWGRPLRRVWRVDYATVIPFGRWRAMVDDASGEILWFASTLRGAKGRVYSSNPTNGALVVEELQGLTADDRLIGEHAAVTTCASFDNISHCRANAAPDPAGDYLFQPVEPSLEDPFAEVQAYYHVDRVHRWFHQRFGFSRPGESQQIKVVVNFSFEMDNGQVYGIENAFYGDIDGDDQPELVFGQAADRDYAYDADVIYHEFGHSVVAETSDLEQALDDLGWNVMSGALNEGVADYFSAALAGDGLVGEYAGGPSGIRQLDGDATCPGDLDGESHHDSLIWSRANWRVREQTEDKNALDEVLYTTVTSLGQHADFAEAAALVRAVALERHPALLPLIAAEYAAAGLDGCTRVVPVNPRRSHTSTILGRDDLGLPFTPAPFQYRLDVPAQATEMVIKLVSKVALVTGALAGFVRAGEQVEYRVEDIPVHHLTLNEHEPQLRIALDDAENPLLPGTAYYVLPVNVGRNLDHYEISVSYKLPPAPDASIPPPPDAGVPDDGGDRDGRTSGVDTDQQGCGCSVRNEGAPSPWWLLLLGMFLRRSPRRPGRK